MKVFTLVTADEFMKLMGGPEVYSSSEKLCDRLVELMGYPDDAIDEEDESLLGQVQANLEVDEEECSFERGGMTYCVAVTEVR